MITKDCVIQLIINDKVFYVDKHLKPVESFEKAVVFSGKRKTKRICDIIKTDKRIKTKILDLGGQ